MVVRAVLGSVVSHIPYSDHLPRFILHAIYDDASSYESAQLESPLASSSEVNGPMSPQQKIHSHILKHRGSQATPALPNDEFSLDDPPYPALPNGDPSDALTESETVQDPDTTSQSMVQKYLDEQNAKFDSLINKNLNVVLQQQNMFEDESSWQQLMVEMAMSRDKDEINLKMTSLMGKASTWIQSHIPRSLSSRSPSQPNSQPVSRAAVTEADTNEPTDAVVRADDATIENFLDLLEYQTKINLLKQLRIDLGLSDYDDLLKFSKELSKTHSSAPTLLIDKFETLMIISVRLWFICLKFTIPVATLMYLKFKNNDVLFFNNKNFNRLLSFTIKFMESLEKRLKAETLNAYQYGQQPQTDFLSQAIEHEDPVAEIESPIAEAPVDTPKATWTDTFTKMAINYWLKSGNSQADFAKDPRYAQYFSGKKETTTDWDAINDANSGEQVQPSFIDIAQQFADQLK